MSILKNLLSKSSSNDEKLRNIENKLETILELSKCSIPAELESTLEYKDIDVKTFLKEYVEKNKKDFMFLVECSNSQAPDEDYITYNFACSPENNKKLAIFLYALLNGFLTDAILDNLEDSLYKEYVEVKNDLSKQDKRPKKSKQSYISPLKVFPTKENKNDFN